MTTAGRIFLAFFLGCVASAETDHTVLALAFLWAMAITILVGAMHVNSEAVCPTPKQ